MTSSKTIAGLHGNITGWNVLTGYSLYINFPPTDPPVSIPSSPTLSPFIKNLYSEKGLLFPP